MRITYNLLKQYMDLSDVTPEQLAEALTRGGLEVEGIEPMAQATKLVIGYVEECVDHPDSDHLHVCQVNDGTGIRQIVCGAPNVRRGQKVVVALPGCVLPGGEIKSGKVRGQLSDGMICALFELGVDKKQLTEEQLSGIEVLPEDAPVGCTDVLGYLNLDDVALEVSLTPNRADCLAFWSLAKEVGALLNKKVDLPDYSYEADTVSATLVIKSETEKCPLFEGKIINHVTIKPSPKWMQNALQAAGVKAINNVVDISNYVMLETGQPLHFYDLAKIPLKEITVKTDLNEKYTALDGIEYQILENDIMITTGGKAIGIAGVMGGDDSKIDEETKGIIIEAATFNSVSIRNTARRLDLQTEAATHFMKGIDPLAGHKAVERSVQLLIELADATGIEETVVCGDNGYKPTEIVASLKQMNRVLGTQFTFDQMYSAFARLDFQPEALDEDRCLCHIPSYREDIKVWQDLSEEMIRLLGYEHVPVTLPLMPTIQGGYNEAGKLRRTVQNIMNGHGLMEIISYSLVSGAKINEGILSVGEPVEVANAISEERRYYRTSLLPSMLDIVGYNVARKNDQFGFFELANVYNNQNREEKHLSLALSEKTDRSLWQKDVATNDFYTMKGIILALLDKLGYKEERIRFAPIEDGGKLLHPYQSADVYVDKVLVGKAGVMHPELQNRLDCGKCVIAELNMTAITAIKNAKVRFVPVNRYPEVSYDLALVVEESVTAEQLIAVIRKAGGRLLKNIGIFDVYRGTNIAEGCKSVAVKVTYQSVEKTLTEADIMPVHNEILNGLRSKLHAVLRDS